MPFSPCSPSVVFPQSIRSALEKHVMLPREAPDAGDPLHTPAEESSADPPTDRTPEEEKKKT